MLHVVNADAHTGHVSHNPRILHAVDEFVLRRRDQQSDWDTLFPKLNQFDGLSSVFPIKNCNLEVYSIPPFLDKTSRTLKRERCCCCEGSGPRFGVDPPFSATASKRDICSPETNEMNPELSLAKDGFSHWLTCCGVFSQCEFPKGNICMKKIVISSKNHGFLMSVQFPFNQPNDKCSNHGPPHESLTGWSGGEVNGVSGACMYQATAAGKFKPANVCDEGNKQHFEIFNFDLPRSFGWTPRLHQIYLLSGVRMYSTWRLVFPPVPVGN